MGPAPSAGPPLGSWGDETPGSTPSLLLHFGFPLKDREECVISASPLGVL